MVCCFFQLRKTILIGPALVLLTLLFTPGCGSGELSQADMIEVASRRKRNKSEAANVEKKTATKKKVEKAQLTVTSEDATTKETSVKESVPGEKLASSGGTTENEVEEQKIPLSDTKQKSTPLATFPERCRISAENLERIAQAFEAYLQDKGKYPPRAIYGAGGAPLLSWRVELLPYLGYKPLYDQFELDKPWNSPVNKALLDKIPSIYQSPERFDNRTNYLVVTGSSTVFPGPRTPSLRRIEDGVEHTLLLVEVDENLATAWTKPQEYEYMPGNPKQGLGELRKDTVYVIWGGGVTGALPIGTPVKKFKAMYTIDGGESFSSYSVSIPLDEDYFASFAPQESNRRTNSESSLARSGLLASSPRALSSNSQSQNQSDLVLSKYYDAARTAYAMHQPADALLWYYAANLLQLTESECDKHYHWIPGLQRPGSVVHFCIGIHDKSQSNKTRSVRKTKQRGKLNREITMRAISESGESLLYLVEQHSAKVAPEALATANTKTFNQVKLSAPGDEFLERALPVTYLGYGSRSETTQQAIANAADVLVLIEISNSKNDNKQWLSFDFVDLARGKILLSLSHIQLSKGNSRLNSQRADGILKKKRWQLQDLLEESLVFQDWPDNLKPKHAKQRVQSLAKKKSFNTLAALTEMIVYRNRNLIDSQELLSGLRELLGEDQGENLMLGSEQKRLRILRNWLPATALEEYQHSAF